MEFVSSLGLKEEPEKDPLHIYTNDIYGCVAKAHVMIGELSYPSLGLGWELGVATDHRRIRVMMCAKKGRNISYLPRGAALHAKNRHSSFHLYKKSLLELVPYFLEEIELLRKK